MPARSVFRLCQSLLLCLLSGPGWAQDGSGQGIEAPPARMEVGGFHLPADLAGHVNNAAWLQVSLDPELAASLEAFHNTYVLSERLRLEILLKQRLGNRLYLFGGLEWEREIGAMAPVSGYRFGSLLGMGYQPTRNLNLEAGWSQPFQATRLGSFGGYGQGAGAAFKARIRY